ncbi:MAG TPA: T9SS type A sorting domain-containing protein [Candidatus Kapabacteria bacterium]|nr:T9SS type A sorting domain-containing protein [Candidatus Kapabacteria bacterium]
MARKLILFFLIILIVFGTTSNAVSQWQLVAHPFRELPHPPGGGTKSFTLIDSTLFAGGFSGIVRSTDEGVNWDSAGLADKDIDAILGTGTYLFAGGGRYNPGFFRSANKGNSWTRIDSGIIVSVQALAQLDTVLFVGALGNSQGSHYLIFRSSDMGMSWNNTNTGYPSVFATSFASIGKIFFAGVNGGIFSSTDDGINWVLPDTDKAFTPNVFCLASVGTILFSGGDEGILRSTDSGTSWDTAYLGDYVLSTAIKGANIFAGTINHGVLLSSDNGKTWEQINEGMGDIRINTLIVSGNYLFAGDEAGEIWRRSLSDFSVVSTVVGTLTDISLSPNPTTGLATVYNAPPDIQHVSVTNILGESVIELARPNGPEFTIDLSKFHAGIYFCVMQMNSQTVVRQILLVR